MGIERRHGFVVHSTAEQGEGGEELAAGGLQSFQGRVQDVVAALDEVEAGEVELGAVGGVGGPAIKVAAMGPRRVDQAGQHTDQEGVIAAVGVQVIANVG